MTGKKVKVSYFYARVKLNHLKTLCTKEKMKRLKGSVPDLLLKPYVRGKGFISFNEDGEMLFTKIKPYNKGGAVFCVIETPMGKRVRTIADCSFSDNFNYEIGRNIAYGRATKLLAELV